MPKNLGQLGVSGLNRYGGYVYEELLPELKYPNAAKVYNEMASNDPVIGSILYLSEMLIRAVSWNVEAASSSKEDLDNRQFLIECMNDMSISWAEFITEVISMMTYGFDFHEIVYKIRKGPNSTSPKFNSKFSDGKIGWRKFAPRAQATLHEWVFSEDGDAIAFVQLAPPLFKRIEIPMSKGMLFRTRVHKNNPEGKSLLRNAYRPWYFKKRIEEIEAIGIERDLAGLPSLQPPEGMNLWDEADEEMVKARHNAESIVEGVRNDATSGVLLPFGWDFKLVSTGGTRQFDTNAIINRYDYRIASTMLADLVIMGSEGSGSYALADIKNGIFSTALEAMLLNIADVINKQAVEPLFILNGINPKNGYPKIVPDHVKKPSIKEVALLLRTANLDINNDIKFHNFVRDACGLEDLDEAEFKKIYSDPAKQAMDNANAKPNNNVKLNNRQGREHTGDTIDNENTMPDSHIMTGGA